jgi:hypothetical protein
MHHPCKFLNCPSSACRLFTDAYNVFCVEIITPMIAFSRWPMGAGAHSQGPHSLGHLPSNVDLSLKVRCSACTSVDCNC